MDLAGERFADVVVLRLAGSIDHGNAGELREALATHLPRCARGADGVVLDLAGLEYISSAALRVLMQAAKQVKAQGGRLVVAALTPAVAEIFEISRFNLVLETFPSVRDAIASLSPAALAAFGG